VIVVVILELLKYQIVRVVEMVNVVVIQFEVGGGFEFEIIGLREKVVQIVGEILAQFQFGFGLKMRSPIIIEYHHPL